MKLHEYQARDLLASHGVPLPGGRVASTPPKPARSPRSLAAASS